MAPTHIPLPLRTFLLLTVALGIVSSDIKAQQIVEGIDKRRVIRNEEEESDKDDSSQDSARDEVSPPAPQPAPISFIGPPGSDYVFTNPPSNDYRFLDPDDGCAGDGTPKNCRDTQKDCCPNPNDPSQYICCIPPSDNSGQTTGGAQANSGSGASQSGQNRGGSLRGQGGSTSSFDRSRNQGSTRGPDKENRENSDEERHEKTIAIAPLADDNKAG